MINERPTICNICGGAVRLTSNAEVYGGKEFGSGKCYLCTVCGAYVGTHRVRPKDALGILANKEMRDAKIKCHDLFDSLWRNENTERAQQRKRAECYAILARRIGIEKEDCHFGHFGLPMLNRAYNEVLKMKEENT